MFYDYLIVGSGIAGMTAAETIRSRDTHGRIAVFGDELHPTYSRVLLPHLVRGKVGEGKTFLKTTVEAAVKNIDFVPGRRVISVDTALHSVQLADNTEVRYGKLLIATGGRARPLTVPGAAEANLRYFQTLDDARILRDIPKATGAHPPQAAIIGSGFIAIELIMAYVERGYGVTVVCRHDGLFSKVLDPQSRAHLEDQLKKNGVTILKQTEVTSIKTSALPLSRSTASYTLQLSTNTTIEATEIGVGIGLIPNIDFLQGSGIATDLGVLVDDQLKTNTPDVFAAGDVAEITDPNANVRRLIGNWQNALFQGRLVGTNLTGATDPYNTVTNYAISCFGLPITFIGATEIPGDERIVREHANSTIQYILKGERVIGATCVGPLTERAKVMALVQSGEKVISTDL